MATTVIPGESLALWQPGSTFDVPALACIFGAAAYFMWPVVTFAWPAIVVLQVVLFAASWRFLGADVRRRAEHAAAVAAAVVAPKPTSSQLPVPMAPLQRRLSLGQRIQKQSAAVNPFVNPTWRITQLERARLALMCSSLVPLRVLGMVVVVLLTSLISYAATLGVSGAALKSAPLSGIRRLCVRWIVCPLMRILLLVMGFVYVPTRGRPAGTAEAPVIVSNHVCFLEPIYLLSVFGAMPVGEQSNLKAPVIGPIIRALQLIGVDRKDPNSRHAVAEAIKQRAASHAWQQILLFPEGTCTVGNALIQFKPGAFNPGAPVQPCLVRYHNARSNPAWVCGGPKVAVLLVRMLCEPINFLSCEYLPTYVPNAAEKADAILFARNVRAAMAARLGVPVTEHSFEDIVLQQEALAAGQSPETFQIELDKVKAALHVDLASVKKQLAKFKAMDKNGDGTLDVDEFERGLGFTQPSDVVRNLFSQLDVHDSGRIDFRQFLLGLGVLSSSSDADQDAVVELAFKMFDVEGSGRVRVAALHKAFRAMLPDASTEEECAAFADLEAQDAGDGVALDAFKQFATRDPRYLKLFRKTMGGVHDDEAAGPAAAAAAAVAATAAKRD